MAFSFGDLLTDPQLSPFLPFVFVLVIVYGLLSMVPALRWGGKINMILAFVFAAFSAGYQPFLDVFYANFAILLWFFVIMFLIVFLASIFGVRGGKVKGKEDGAIFIIGLLMLIFFTAINLGYFDNIEVLGLEKNDLLLVVGILLFILILYYAYEHGRSPSLEEAMRKQQGMR